MKGNMYHFYVEDINMMYIMIIIYIIKQIDNDWIVLLRTSVWYKISLNTSLTPPLSIEVPIPSQGSSWSCICVLRISTLPVSTTVVLDFGTVLKVWYFLLYICSFNGSSCCTRTIDNNKTHLLAHSFRQQITTSINSFILMSVTLLALTTPENPVHNDDYNLSFIYQAVNSYEKQA